LRALLLAQLQRDEERHAEVLRSLEAWREERRAGTLEVLRRLEALEAAAAAGAAVPAESTDSAGVGALL
jgi:hypothetical protein